MRLKELQRNWDAFGASDPLWAILTAPEKAGNKWDVDEFFATGIYEIRDLMAWVAAIHPQIRKRRALDFGCGVGRLTQPLAEHFDVAMGVDLAPSMIRLAEQYNRHGERCRYVLNEAANLSYFDDGAFDLIYSGLTLQHMAPRYMKLYLEDFLRVLAPGGLLVFRLPSAPSRNDLGRRVWRWVWDLLYQRIYWNLFRRGEPVMQMHGIKREEVLALLHQRGAEALVVEPDGSAGEDWIAFRYFIVKPAVNEDLNAPRGRG
ncbi:MAG: class I SAM-dependent methyltransferase [Bryobacteraceae bacterium]